MENYYQLLGLRVDATAEEIKQRCLELGQAVRPDKHGEGNGTRKRFEEVERAFVTLTNLESRAAYDATVDKTNEPAIEMQHLVPESSEYRMSKGKTLGIAIGVIVLLGALNYLGEAARIRNGEAEREISELNTASSERKKIEAENAEKEAEKTEKKARFQAAFDKCDQEYFRDRGQSKSDAAGLCGTVTERRLRTGR